MIDKPTNVAAILQQYSKREEWFKKIPNELISLADMCNKRTSEKKDLAIAITSFEEGSGKSSLAMLLGFLIDMQGFDLLRNIAYIADGDKIKKQFWSLSSGEVLILDEAIKAFYKMDFASGVQKMLVQMFATERWQEKISIFCIPRIIDLNENFRAHKVKIWIKVMKRGYAVVHVKDPDNMYDPWHLEWDKKYMRDKLGFRKVGEVSFAERLKMERMKRTYMMEFEFPELPRVLYKRYEELKMQTHTEDAEKGEEAKQDPKVKFAQDALFKACQKFKADDPKISQQKMADLLGVSKVWLSEFTKANNPEFWEKPKVDRTPEKVPEYLLKLRMARDNTQNDQTSVEAPKEELDYDSIE